MSEREDIRLPAGEEAPTTEELEQARELAASVERLLASAERGSEAPTRAAAAAEPRAESFAPSDEASAAATGAGTAGMIHAALHGARLDPTRAQAAVLEAVSAARPAPSALRRSAPVIALAASLMLAIGVTVSIGALELGRDLLAPPTSALAGSAAVLASPASSSKVSAPSPESRPSDDLLGRPIRAPAAASARLDRVFASRLAGYRQLTLSGTRFR